MAYYDSLAIHRAQNSLLLSASSTLTTRSYKN